MKVLLASSSSGSRGGGELYLLYLGRALAERGHDVALWASRHERMDELARLFAEIGRVHRCPYTNTYDRPLRSLASFADLASAQRVARSWGVIGADVIHINKQNLEDGLDLIAAARLTGIPNLTTIHLSQTARFLRAIFAPMRDTVSRWVLKRYPGLLVTVLEQRRQDLAEFIGESPRLRMIPNGVPLFDLSTRETIRRGKRAELGIREDEVLVVAVGRLVPQKRPFEFVEQARIACAEQTNLRFLWVGDGVLAEAWDERVRALGLGERVTRLPWQREVHPLLFAGDIFIHVAEFEGLPLAILEAMSAGLPCAIAEHLLAEMSFLPRDYAVPVTSSGGWVQRLAEPSERELLGRRVRSLVESRFSYEAMAASYEALYVETTRLR